MTLYSISANDYGIIEQSKGNCKYALWSEWQWDAILNRAVRVDIIEKVTFNKHNAESYLGKEEKEHSKQKEQRMQRFQCESKSGMFQE